MEKIAYSYIRISSQLQVKGDGLRRQTAEAVKVCREKGWTLSTRKFEDAGVSAFDGSNLKSNKGLGRLLALIEEGHITPGSVILIEALDRISRASPLDALALLTRIASTGVEVYTTIDNQHFTSHRLNNDPSCLFITIGQLIRGRDESEKKSKRSKDWVEFRQSKSLPYTGRSPFWIVGRPVKGQPYELVPDKVEIVREVYRLAEDGYGSTAIAGILNKTLPKADGKLWYPSVVNYLLNSESVYGRLVKIDGSGDYIDDYYPAVISPQHFHRVRGIVENRTKFKNNFKGGNPHSVANLFTNRVFCECGSALKFGGKVRDDGYDGRALKCLAAMIKQCDAVIINYKDAEEELLYWMMIGLGVDFSPEANQRADIAAIQKQIHELDKVKENLLSAISSAQIDGVIKAMVMKIEKAEKEKDNLMKKLKSFDREEVVYRNMRDRREIFWKWLHGVHSQTGEDLVRLRKRMMSVVQSLSERIVFDRKPDLANPLKPKRRVVMTGELTNGESIERALSIRVSSKIQKRLLQG